MSDTPAGEEMQKTKSGEKVVSQGPSVFKAPLRGGPRDGEIIEAIGFSLPSDLIYPADGSNSAFERKYTLRGTPATGWYYEYYGTYDVDTREFIDVGRKPREEKPYDLADYE